MGDDRQAVPVTHMVHGILDQAVRNGLPNAYAKQMYVTLPREGVFEPGYDPDVIPRMRIALPDEFPDGCIVHEVRVIRDANKAKPVLSTEPDEVPDRRFSVVGVGRVDMKQSPC